MTGCVSIHIYRLHFDSQAFYLILTLFSISLILFHLGTFLDSIWIIILIEFIMIWFGFDFNLTWY